MKRRARRARSRDRARRRCFQGAWVEFMEDDGTWYACAVLVVGLSSAYDRRVKQVRLKYCKHAQFTVDVDESTQHKLTAPPGTHVPLVQKLWKKHGVHPGRALGAPGASNSRERACSHVVVGVWEPSVSRAANASRVETLVLGSSRCLERVPGVLADGRRGEGGTAVGRPRSSSLP